MPKAFIIAWVQQESERDIREERAAVYNSQSIHT